MDNSATVNFMNDFKGDAFLLFGIVYFSLFMTWLFSLRDQIFGRLRNSAEAAWMAFSLIAGLVYGIVAIMEWGAPASGTALTIGLCISLALANQSAAACLLASSLFLRPWELTNHDPYLGILPRLSIVLCLAHLFLHFADIRKIKIEWNPLASDLIAFTIWTFVSTLFAIDPNAAQSEFFDGFVKSIFLYLILIQMLRTKHALRMLLITLLLSFLFVGLI